MTSLIDQPVAAIVDRYARDLAIVHKTVIEALDEVVAGLDEINKRDAGQQRGYVLAPVFRRRVAPVLAADLEGSELGVDVGQFDSLRIAFKSSGRAQVVARVRKRTRTCIVVDRESWPALISDDMLPGVLVILWEMEGDQVRGLTLARVDQESLEEDVMIIYEEASFPPPADGVYQAPPGSSNDDDDLRGIVKPRDDDENDGVGGIGSQ